MLPIKQFYYFSKLFGLAPFPLDGIAAKKEVRFSAAADLLLTGLVMLLYASNLVSILWNSEVSSSISRTANWIQFVPNSFAYIFAMVFAYRKRAIICDILRMFELCDERLLSQFRLSTVDLKNKLRKTSLMACLVTLISGGAACGFNFTIAVRWTHISTLFYWLAFCIPKFGLLLYTFQFAGSIMLLSDRTVLLLKGINNCLTEINHRELKGSSGSPSESTADYRMVKPQTSDTLEGIHQMVEHLQQLANNINDCFGKQAIFSLLSAFICITVQLYYLLNLIRFGFATPGAAFYCLASISLLLLHGIEFYALVTNGDLARVHWRRLMNCLFVAKAKSDEENFRAKMDDLIAFMGCNIPEFHAFGLFPIDLSVLTGIASSIATYLIVLVQFKASEEENGGLVEPEVNFEQDPRFA
ncbi:gustatory and pheromone receptor 32a-like [Sabethes cyaneus]|uniref:gustatory and pheromone receptor 32a-like n=1 Tax=Sabethes cyaneus TaxID=53552 RepID=UPI00237D61CF|nr:gustatory and pheromone receptor 32a-like [Sabethes cyaneus]